MGEEQRRDTRYKLQLPVRLTAGRQGRRLLTENVSFRGLFVRTDSPPVLRQLITVEAQLPPNDTLFQSHGMSVYVVEPGDPSGHVPGVGIQFYAMGDARRPWERFVQGVRADRAVRAESNDEVVDAIRRRHPRHEVVLAVTPKTVEELVTMFTRDVSAGGMFIQTEQDIEAGRTLGVDVSHPRSEGVFSLTCVVRRHGDGSETTGVGVEFVDMTPECEREFYEFIMAGLTEDERERVELVPPGDSRLE